jgi:hypothetical protein
MIDKDSLSYVAANGFYFSSQEYMTSWGDIRIREISAWFDDCCKNIVGPYLPITPCPQLHFNEPERAVRLIRILRLPSYASAAAIKADIHLFFGVDEHRWQDILCHETVHAGIWQTFRSSMSIPQWINEGLAYVLGNNTKFDRFQLVRFLSQHRYEIVQDILADVVRPHHKVDICILKSLGLYFEKFAGGADNIRRFFLKVLKHSNVTMSFKQTFGVDLVCFLRQWMESLYIPNQT